MKAQTKVFPVQRTRKSQASLGIAPWIHGNTRNFNVQTHGLFNTANGHRSVHVQLTFPNLFNRSRRKRQLGVVFHIKEIRAFQVTVAVRILSVHTCNVCFKRELCVGEIVGLSNHAAVERCKPTGNGGDHEVARFESNFGVRGV